MSPVYHTTGAIHNTFVKDALGPLILAMALVRVPRAWLIAALAAGFLSDVFDGVLARCWQVVTVELRRADSGADAVFYGCIAAAACLTAPDLVRPLVAPLLCVLALQAFSYGIDLARYGRLASFHAYSAKLWGLALFIAAVAALGFHHSGRFLWLAIGLGVLSNLEGLAMKAILPDWTPDVLSVFHVLRLRRTVLGSGR